MKRLIIFREKGFARYYVGFRDVVKRCEWVYMSIDALKLLEKYAERRINRNPNLVLPKYITKIQLETYVEDTRP